MLTATGEPLATGLPADPVAAARAYVAANRDLLGLTAGRRRRPRGADRGPDGRRRRRPVPPALRRPGRRRSTACCPSASATARSGTSARRSPATPPPPAPATLSAGRRRAGRHRATPASPTPRSCGPSWSRCRRPTGGARAAYEVVLRRRPERRRPGGVHHLRRRPRRRRPGAREPGRLRRGQPGVGGLPELAADRLLLDRHPACAGASRRAAAATRRRHARRRRWPGTSTRRPARRPDTTNGNNAIAVHNWNSNDPFTVGTETATPRPDRDYTYPWTNQWYEERCNPDDVHLARSATTSTPRGPTCSRCTTACTTGPTTSASPRRRSTCSSDNFGARRARRRPRAGQRPGRRHHRRPADLRRPRQRQPDHPAATASRRSPTCTCGSRSPGSFYAPCVDGDYDMSVIGHEYTPRHHQPDDRRPERRSQLAAGHERELVGPAGDGVPLRARLRAARARGPSRSASTSPATRSPASATTT